MPEKPIPGRDRRLRVDLRDRNRSREGRPAVARWRDRLVRAADVGRRPRLATTGDGSMILIACYTHGSSAVRHRRAGGGSLSPGRIALASGARLRRPDDRGATLKGELAILSGAGNVRWRTTLNRPAIALETDALGRYVDLWPGDRRDRPARPPGHRRSPRLSEPKVASLPSPKNAASRVGAAFGPGPGLDRRGRPPT